MTLNLNNPCVCICIPTYNAEATIEETLISILKQTYKNLVIKVIDNCSKDNTLAIVRNFSDPRIKIYENEINIGGEGNFNRCIQLAIGPYTAIYHADDVYEHDIVQKQVDFLQNNPNVGVVLTEAKLIDDGSNTISYSKIPRSIKTKDDIYNFTQLFKGILKYSNFLFCPSAMVKTDIYKKEIVVWRKELFYSSGDLDVWLRIAINHSVGIIPLPLINYRISNSQWSAEVRRSSKRADFFLVMDYYLNQDYVKKNITQVDLRNYSNLDRRDRVMRAVNLFLQNNTNEAYSLCSDVFSFVALKEAIFNKRGKGTLIFGGIIKLSILTNLQNAGKKMIQGLIMKYNK